MKFCPRCGQPLVEKMVEGEDRLRLVCSDCAYIFYMNPKVVAGAIPIVDGRALLLRRGIEPRRGAWTFPGGFMEMGETVEEAACRETREEVNLDVRLTGLLSVYSRPAVGVVVVVYTAEVVGGEARVGPEALEIGLFGPGDVPWHDLAFPSTEAALYDWVRRARGGAAD